MADPKKNPLIGAFRAPAPGSTPVTSTEGEPKTAPPVQDTPPKAAEPPKDTVQKSQGGYHCPHHSWRSKETTGADRAGEAVHRRSCKVY